MAGIVVAESDVVSPDVASCFLFPVCLAVALAAVAVYMKRIRKASWNTGLFAVCMSVALIGLGIFSALWAQGDNTVQWPRAVSSWRGVVVQQPRLTAKTCRATLILDSAGQSRTVSVSFLRNAVDSVPQVGDVLRFDAEMREPYNSFESNFDYARWLKRQGVSGMAFVYRRVDFVVGPEAETVIGGLPALEHIKLSANGMRSALIARYGSLGLDDEDFSVLSAVTLGEKSFISKQTRASFSDSGTSHVLALSGLHLGILMTFLMLLLRPLRYYRWGQWASAVGCISLMVGFVLLTGCSVSVVRSAIMLTLVLLLGLRGQGFASLNNVALAAMAILLFSPLSLFDLGFQLSFLAVFSLVFFMPYFRQSALRSRMGRLGWLTDFCYVSIVAQLATAPLVACAFGRFSVLFLLANAIVIPCAYIILVVAMAFLLLSWIPPVSVALGWLLKTAVGIMTGGVEWVASLPVCGIDLHLSPLACLLTYPALILLAFYAVCPRRQYLYWLILAVGLLVSALLWRI